MDAASRPTASSPFTSGLPATSAVSSAEEARSKELGSRSLADDFFSTTAPSPYSTAASAAPPPQSFFSLRIKFLKNMIERTLQRDTNQQDLLPQHKEKIKKLLLELEAISNSSGSEGIALIKFETELRQCVDSIRNDLRGIPNWQNIEGYALTGPAWGKKALEILVETPTRITITERKD